MSFPHRSVPQSCPYPLTLSQHKVYVNFFLRGLAIIAVLILHFLSSLYQGFNLANPMWQTHVGLDQLCRFAVPLFVALSGYGFWQKYQKCSFQYLPFLWNQIWKLLPLYLLASLVFYALFLWYSPWMWADLSFLAKSFLLDLVMGRAAYHLYFVPMIFQLYLLFPLFRWLVQKLPWLSLAAAAVFQVWLYSSFNAKVPSAFVLEHFLTDQQQYFWFFTWMSYFILGMHLPPLIEWAKKQRWLVIVWGIAAYLSWQLVTQNGIQSMLNGLDPIIALRATRPIILLYTSIAIVFVMVVAQMMGRRVRQLTAPIVMLGKYAYAIYLFHVLFLQFIPARWYKRLSGF